MIDFDTLNESKLTDKQIVAILNKGLVHTCNREQRKQVLDYAFNSIPLVSKDKRGK